MSETRQVGDRAADYFGSGYNCSQSVLLAISEHWRIESELIPKIATAFGGGMGRCGSVCGAVAGGVMAIGMRLGTNEPLLIERLESYEAAKAFYTRFKAIHGSVMCRDLLGHDLSQDGEHELAQKEKAFENRCPNFIRTAVEILLSLSSI